MSAIELTSTPGPFFCPWRRFGRVRSQEGWPASTEPTADSIEPPTSGGKAADQQSTDEPPPQPAPSADDPAKVALLDQHRGRHA
jgi:hypothetical protein